MTEVLVSGASVAGTALAYWLGQHGFSVTVVERHPGLRPGGQAIDVRGPALEVLDRMGLLEAAADRKTNIRGSSMVDGDGNELSRDTESTPTGGPIDNPDIELLRDDLVELLYEATQNSAEYLFDDSIVAMDNRGPGVDVTFERAPARSFDLVIGADGLHSNVRALVFGPEERFIKRLGTFAAIFTVPNFLDLDHWQMWHYGETSMAGVYSARNNTEARAMLGFMDPDLRIDYRDTEAQFAEVEQRMADDGWVRPQLLKFMRNAPDFYFDEMSQIVMDHWSIGRVALVGDAAYCCSPLSGQGTSVALLGAYILAGELKSASQRRLGRPRCRLHQLLPDVPRLHRAHPIPGHRQHSGRCAHLAGAVRGHRQLDHAAAVLTPSSPPQAGGTPSKTPRALGVSGAFVSARPSLPGTFARPAALTPSCVFPSLISSRCAPTSRPRTRWRPPWRSRRPPTGWVSLATGSPNTTTCRPWAPPAHRC